MPPVEHDAHDGGSDEQGRAQAELEYRGERDAAAGEVLQKSSGRNGTTERTLQGTLDGQFRGTFSLGLMTKDVRLATQLGREATPPALQRAVQRLGDALHEVRRISHRLRPAELDTLGLPAALDDLAEEFNQHGRDQPGTVEFVVQFSVVHPGDASVMLSLGM